ncbi:MAG: hypothetical protein QM628_06915 [Propionicimonas sp.]
MYIAVSVIVLVGLVTVFASALSAQANTRNRNTATGTVAVAVNSLQTSIRNSSAFDISGNTLRARVAVGDGSGWECRAWALSGGTLYYRAASSAVPTPSDYEDAGWTSLAKGVSGTLADPLAGPSDPLRPFLRNEPQLMYGFDVLVGEAGTGVKLEGSAVPHATGTGSPTSCW